MAKSSFQPSSRLYLAFGSLLLMTLMVALEGTCVSVALSTIATDLQGTAVETFWVGTSYLLGSTVFQPLYGSLSYIFGRKPMIFVALLSFGIGALLCALARNFTIMLLGRSIQGIGGAGLIALTEIVLADLIPLRQRGTYTGVLGSMYALGGGIGPIIGGALAQSQWRWIFWLNLPIIGIATAMVVFYLPIQSISADSSTKLKRIDWIGSTIFLASTSSLLIAISWGGTQFSWSAWQTLLPIFLGAFGIAIFAIFEKQAVAEPLIPRTIFANRSSIIGYISSALQGLLGYGLIYFLPFYIEAVYNKDTLMTGVLILPFSAGIAPAAVVAGLLITKFGTYRWAVLLGWFITLVGSSLLAGLLHADTSLVVFITLISITAMGNGVAAPALQYQIQASQPSQKVVGLALSMFSFARSFGQTLGVALSGTLFENGVQRELQASSDFAPQASVLSQSVAQLLESIKTAPTAGQKAELLTAFCGGLRYVLISLAVFSAFAFVLSFFVQGYDVNVELNEDYGMKDEKPAVAPA